jgi:hypothetical protein
MPDAFIEQLLLADEIDVRQLLTLKMISRNINKKLIHLIWLIWLARTKFFS